MVVVRSSGRAGELVKFFASQRYEKAKPQIPPQTELGVIQLYRGGTRPERAARQRIVSGFAPVGGAADY